MSDHDPSFWPILCTLLRRARRGPCVDIGANRGDFTADLIAAFPDRTVIAFEPAADVCSRLRARFADESRIVVEEAALWRRNGEERFQHHADSGTSSFFQRNRSGRRYYAANDSVTNNSFVKTLTFDHYSQLSGRRYYALAKLDVQGAELEVLKGASTLLREAAIDIIYLEFFVIPHYEAAGLFPDAWQLLRQFGYDLYDLFKGPHGSNGQLRFGDAIFLSPTFRTAQIDSAPEEP